MPPSDSYFSLEDLVKGPLPQFGYQIHLASGDVETFIKDENSIRQFFKAMYGGRGPNGEILFDPHKGLIAEHLDKIGDNKLLNGKVRVDLLCWDAWRLYIGEDAGTGSRGDGLRGEGVALLSSHGKSHAWLARKPICLSRRSVQERREEHPEDRLCLSHDWRDCVARRRFALHCFIKKDWKSYFDKRGCTDGESDVGLLRQAV